MSTVLNAQWADDLLNRKQDAQFIYSFLVGQVLKLKRQGKKASYVLNLDAEWGGGKTFFLERLAEDLKVRGHVVVAINAWRNDYVDDPYVAIMAAFEEALSPLTKSEGRVRTAWRAAKEKGGAIALRAAGAVGKGIVRKTLGIEIDELLEASIADKAISDPIADGISTAEEQIEKLFDTSMENLISSFRKAERSSNAFQHNLENTITEISKEKCMPVFVLIDELDRCRPSYAINLLERVKHLFSVPDLVFVFGTNTAQLGHCISGIYGATFDGHNYLNRFFDRTYSFLTPSISDLVASEIKNIETKKINTPNGQHQELISCGLSSYNLDIRSIKCILSMMDAVLSAWQNRIKVELFLLLPLCVHYYRNRTPDWPKPQSIPSAWSFMGAPLRRLNFADDTENEVRVQHVYNLCVGVIFDLNKAIELYRREPTDAGERYVAEMFAQEWSGQASRASWLSAQCDLLGLVANAGRLSAPPDASPIGF